METQFCPGQAAQLDRASLRTPEACDFDSGQGQYGRQPIDVNLLPSSL